eukprot:2444057-Prorocentrum_lima.AAC.1
MDDEALQRTISSASLGQFLRLQQFMRDCSREKAIHDLEESIDNTEEELRKTTITSCLLYTSDAADDM